MLTLPGYKVLNCLYEGTTSTLYRALRLSDGLPVVVKVSTQKTLTEKKVQRFQREFDIGRQIQSPQIIRYLELKQDPTYGIALILEDDESAELTSFIPAQGFSSEEFLNIAIQITQGLQAIHAANIVHNDLKPSNIVIQPSTQHIKIIDFNRASSLRQEIQPAISTHLEVGTLAYISPEQTGRINRMVDYRTDFYSLGITFYRLLCGQLPFTATDTLGLIHQHLAKQPTPPCQIKSTIPLPLSQMVMKLLEKEAEKRYQSCEGVLHDLILCLVDLHDKIPIHDFEVGQQDVPSKLAFSQRLYGRESEIHVLLQTFERISAGQREVLMVAGSPGVGKTLLIQEIQKPVTLKNGYFIAGKFDQLNKNVAYSAVSQAFNNLMLQWLSEDETSIAQRKAQLLAALGHQAQFIVQVVPMLALLIGEQPATVIANINQAKNMFNLAFHAFVKVCASAAHPLVMFLDDLQWADQATLELMTYLLQQPTLSHLLWIGAYRDTEVTALHPVQQTIAALQETPGCVHTLLLASLSFENVCQWIADSLHKSLADVQPLVEVVYQKTAGNPFFVKLFLQSLYDQHLLTFSSKTYWHWDLDQIRRHPATENVITLMAYHIRQLPANTQTTLILASCLSHSLALSTLQTVMAASQEVVDAALQPALNSGILISTDSEIYFVHDRVQEAAYGLIAESERAHTHLTIGKRLLANPHGEDVLLFDTVAQFNRCRSLVADPQERLQMFRLNLKAEQKAKQATAYAEALTYLHAGEEWIMDSKALWQTDYSLAFIFYKELAETEFLSGLIDISQDLIVDIMPRLQSTLDKVEIYHLLIIQKIIQGQQQEAILSGHQALQLFGIGLPLDNPIDFVQRELPLFKQRLAATTFSSLLNMPIVVDPEKQAIFKILAVIISACYGVNSMLLPTVIVMSINLSLTYGHAPESCHCYAAYGLLLCAQFKEYASGYEFGSLALQLAEKFQSPQQHCRSAFIMFGFIHMWTKSIQDLPTILDSTFETGIACDEIEYASYCGNMKIQMLFDKGSSLDLVQHEIAVFLQFCERAKIKAGLYSHLQGLRKVVSNLADEKQNEDSFSNENNIKEETAFVDMCQKLDTGNMILGLYHTYKAQALYICGHAKLALQQLDLAKNKLAHISSLYELTLFNWYDSLTRLVLYPTASPDDQAAYLQQVTQNQQQMQIWQANCPENFAHKYLLVEAELARVQGNSAQAEESYDQAIELAGQHSFIQEQALAAELAAHYWLTRGKPLRAQGYLNMALNGYEQWGAKRKLAQLKTKHADLLHALASSSLSPLNINSETTLSGKTLKNLDLSSIIKASHTISSEIELSKLLRNIMQLIIESAGAQKGAVLFIEADDAIFIQAEYSQDGNITTLQKIPLAEWTQGALTVINYVKRLHQPAVIDNATVHDLFMTDPYVTRTNAKSILCIPMLKQAELKAMLYAENNLMSYAFTSERVQTVLILTAQMAISLANARYFEEQLELTRKLAEQSTRARIAEEKLQAISHDLELALQASKAGTWNLWIESQKVTWDTACCALFGLKPEMFRGNYEAVIERIHPDDRKRVNEAVKRCIDQDISYDIETRVIWPDGSEHILSTQGRVYHDTQGRPFKMAGVCIDVTQRKQLEEERLQALKHAEEKERHRAEEAEKYRRDLEDFINMMCHEIRNPMSGIYGNIDFLQQAITSLNVFKENISHERQPAFNELLQKLGESTQEIQQCVKHQKAIIDDVLDLSKIEAGKMEFKHESFRLKSLIEETAKIFAAPVKKKQLQLQLIVPDADPWVKGDANRIKMVLINFMANALKFTEHGEIKIHLQLIDVSSMHTTFTLSVEDTGIGMTAQEQSQLFQRFARVASAEYEGSGLGLMISKRFIERMGGHIDVKSDKGKGSQFTIQLTCETAPAELSYIPLTAQAAPIASPSVPTVSKRILIAEDNILNQRILRKQLETAGYHCEVASHGQEALDKWATGSFDFIFMDIEMPIMGGLEATKAIRERERQCDIARKIPIVALSAYASKEFIQEAYSVGVDDYITKPYEKNKLLDAVKKWTTFPINPLPSQQPTAETLLALSLMKNLITLQSMIPPTSTDQTPQMKSSTSFWHQPQPATIQQPARVWMPEVRRNTLYPVLDKLSDALTALGISIIKPEAKYQAKTSHTGWQLYCLKETDECLAVLNLAEEAHVNYLLEIIRQIASSLQAKKMCSGPTHSLVIHFNDDNKLATDAEKLILNVRTQRNVAKLTPKS